MGMVPRSTMCGQIAITYFFRHTLLLVSNANEGGRGGGEVDSELIVFEIEAARKSLDCNYWEQRT